MTTPIQSLSARIGYNSERYDDAYVMAQMLNDPIAASEQSYNLLRNHIEEFGYTPDHVLGYTREDGLYIPHWLDDALQTLREQIKL